MSASSVRGSRPDIALSLVVIDAFLVVARGNCRVDREGKGMRAGRDFAGCRVLQVNGSVVQADSRNGNTSRSDRFSPKRRVGRSMAPPSVNWMKQALHGALIQILTPFTSIVFARYAAATLYC